MSKNTKIVISVAVAIAVVLALALSVGPKGFRASFPMPYGPPPNFGVPLTPPLIGPSRPLTTTLGCTETDYGFDVWTRGTASYTAGDKFESKTDTCGQLPGEIIEYACAPTGGKRISENKTRCPAGYSCVAGACAKP